MQHPPYDDVIGQLVREDPRYPAEAYEFLRRALDQTVRKLSKPDHGPGRHVTGQELLEGIRLVALQEFGPMAFTVLGSWGIHRTEDFGELVYNLVNRGLLGTTKEDRKEDFAAVYDFESAFVAPFLPAAARKKSRPSRPRAQPKENA